jgi:hypothetical protein
MGLRDPFETHGVNLSDPAAHAEEITKSDSTQLNCSRALYIGGTGDLTVQMKDGDVVTFQDIPAGTILPIRVVKVMNATTATNIVLLR